MHDAGGRWWKGRKVLLRTHWLFLVSQAMEEEGEIDLTEFREQAAQDHLSTKVHCKTMFTHCSYHSKSSQSFRSANLIYQHERGLHQLGELVCQARNISFS